MQASAQSCVFFCCCFSGPLPLFTLANRTHLSCFHRVCLQAYPAGCPHPSCLSHLDTTAELVGQQRGVWNTLPANGGTPLEGEASQLSLLPAWFTPWVTALSPPLCCRRQFWGPAFVVWLSDPWARLPSGLPTYLSHFLSCLRRHPWLRKRKNSGKSFIQPGMEAGICLTRCQRIINRNKYTVLKAWYIRRGDREISK